MLPICVSKVKFSFAPPPRQLAFQRILTATIPIRTNIPFTLAQIQSISKASHPFWNCLLKIILVLTSAIICIRYFKSCNLSTHEGDLCITGALSTIKTDRWRWCGPYVHNLIKLSDFIILHAHIPCPTRINLPPAALCCTGNSPLGLVMLTTSGVALGDDLPPLGGGPLVSALFMEEHQMIQGDGRFCTFYSCLCCQ